MIIAKSSSIIKFYINKFLLLGVSGYETKVGFLCVLPLVSCDKRKSLSNYDPSLLIKKLLMIREIPLFENDSGSVFLKILGEGFGSGDASLSGDPSIWLPNC